jgi:regulatory subunit for Cdc7p protein kinase
VSQNDVKTPRKRAVPLEEVHCRNAVAPNPHKRSRSSSTTTGATSTSTSSISAAINEVHIRSQGGDREGVLAGVDQGAADAAADGSLKVEDERASASKTVRIDKQSRLSQTDRMQRDQRKILSTFEWRKKFLRAFPSFRFYLDGYDSGTKAEVEATITSLGGQIEPFFSKVVTHLVTARKVAIPNLSATTGPNYTTETRDDNGGASHRAVGESRPEAANKASGIPSVRSHIPGVTPLSRSSRFAGLRGKKNAAIPLHSDRNPFDEWLPPVPANDILTKARAFDIKIWTHDKFISVTTGLTSDNVSGTSIGQSDPGKAQQMQQVQQILAQKPKEQHAKSLSQLLEKEKVQGIHERDARAPRQDYYYFARNAVYILVEDATGEHRPVMAQEWRRPLREGEEEPWPVLHGELEGRCPFTKFPLEGDPRKRMRPNRHESLRRSVSLNHVRSQQRNVSLSPAPSNDSRGGYSIAREASPYPLASGNSMSIASTNITSTTSTAAPYGNSLGLLSPFHPLARKTAPTSIGLGRPSVSPVHKSLQTNGETGMPGNGHISLDQGSVVRTMLGLTTAQRTANAAERTASAIPVRLLEQQSGAMRRSISTPTVTAELEAKPREKRPGYCENCRVKYEDFDDHVQGRRHRKFATDDTNFTEIDELLRRVSRPIASWALDDSRDCQGEEQADGLHFNMDVDWTSHMDPQQTNDDEQQECTSLLDIVESWQKEGNNIKSDEEDELDGELDDIRQRIDAAAAAFRFRTGLEPDRTIGQENEAIIHQSIAVEDQLSTSSPNAASYGVTHPQTFDDDESITSASPQSSQNIATHTFTSTAKTLES